MDKVRDWFAAMLVPFVVFAFCAGFYVGSRCGFEEGATLASYKWEQAYNRLADKYEDVFSGSQD